MIEIPVAGKIGIPFMIAGITTAKLNSTRLMEAVVIAIVSSMMMAGFGYFVAFPVLQEQVLQIRRDISDTKDAMKGVKEYQESRRQLRDLQQQQVDAKIAQLQVEIARLKR